MKYSRLLLIATLTTPFCVAGWAQTNARGISSQTCPYNCQSVGLSKSECKDWRRGNECFVEDLSVSTKPLRICLRPGSNSFKLRRTCNAARGESEVSLSDLKGEKGDTGATGPVGAQGEAGSDGVQGIAGTNGTDGFDGNDGADGQLRIYGDGSAGSRSISGSVTLNDDNSQYVNFVVNGGATLTVGSGTVIRCTGSFQNDGTITILPALRDQPRVGENGRALISPNSGGTEAPGGGGGFALSNGVAKGLVKVGLLGGGNGYREQSETGSDGGGNFTVICAGAVTNSGMITANGVDASVPARGGGAGGIVILASTISVANSGSITANGADGGALVATDPSSIGHGPGGGGGGGIVHLAAPAISNTGSVNVAGGDGGAAGGAGSISAPVYVGGGGGGSSGGAGGDGGAVNPGNIGNSSTAAGTAGSPGQVIQSLINPIALL